MDVHDALKLEHVLEVLPLYLVVNDDLDHSPPLVEVHSLLEQGHVTLAVWSVHAASAGPKLRVRGGGVSYILNTC